MLNQVITKQKTSVWIIAYIFVCVIVIIGFPTISFAQDKIYETDSTVIETKVMEVGEADIKYKKFSYLDGPVYTISKDKVWMIVYKNGEKEVFNQPQKHHQVNIQPPAPSFDSLGYIEQYLGVKLQTTSEQKGGVEIMNKSPGSLLQGGGMGIITYIGTCNKSDLQWRWTRVYNTSGFAKTLFEIRRNSDNYIKFITFKIKKGVGTAKGKAIISDLDLTPINNSSCEKARNFILTENINDAIASYAQLIAKDSNNTMFLAEDAYALALGGIYDAALTRLDRIWYIGANSPDVNYFTAQVFALMRYDDLASEFWKASENGPAWISPKSAILLKKFKRKLPKSIKINREEIIANFKHANELASQSLNFQSIALFHEIINYYPGEYLPYIGYSTTLEKTGALEKSAQSIETAISLIGNNTEDQAKKQLLEKRLLTIKQKIASLPLGTMPLFPQRKVMGDGSGPQWMIYGGGEASPSSSSLNGRIGYYISNSNNVSFDIGKMNRSLELGVSMYSRKRSFVYGTGIMMSTGDGSTNLYLKLSLGFSKMNHKQTSSIDIFQDIDVGLGSAAMFSWSVGKSFYFGKRK